MQSACSSRWGLIFGPQAWISVRSNVLCVTSDWLRHDVCQDKLEKKWFWLLADAHWEVWNICMTTSMRSKESHIPDISRYYQYLTSSKWYNHMQFFTWPQVVQESRNSTRVLTNMFKCPILEQNQMLLQAVPENRLILNMWLPGQLSASLVFNTKHKAAVSSYTSETRKRTKG